MIFLTNRINQKKIRTIVAAFYAPITMHLLLIIFIPASMPRYYFYSIVIGISITIAYFTFKIIERSKRFVNY